MIQLLVFRSSHPVNLRCIHQLRPRYSQQLSAALVLESLDMSFFLLPHAESKLHTHVSRHRPNQGSHQSHCSLVMVLTDLFFQSLVNLIITAMPIASLDFTSLTQSVTVCISCHSATQVCERIDLLQSSAIHRYMYLSAFDKDSRGE